MASQICASQADVKAEYELRMKPYANWETYLVPGPMAIAVLGELIMISGKDDFSLNKNPPKDGFKYIRYPESFRACLMQVSNEGFEAFSTAHKNMDKIRLHSMNIPGYIRQTVQIITKADGDLVKLLLPDQLDNMKEISEECKNLAAEVENKFIFVIHIVQELLEACVNANKVYKEELEDIKNTIEITKMKEKAAKEAKEITEKQMHKMEKFLDSAHTQFNAALQSMPSGHEMACASLAQGFSGALNAISSAITALPNAIISSIRGNNSEESDKNTDKQQTHKKQHVHPTDKITIYSKSVMLCEYASQLRDYLDKESKIDMHKVCDAKAKTIISGSIKKGFEEIKKDIDKEPDCEEKNVVLNICKMGIDFCEQLIAIAERDKSDSDDNIKIADGIQALLNKVQIFDSESKKATNASAFTLPSPNMVNSGFLGGGSVCEQMSLNAQFKIEQTKQQIQCAQENYEKTFEAMNKASEKLNDILATLQTLNVKEIDFKTTVKMLIEGMKALGNVKEQWEKMVRFFQIISGLVETCLNKSVKQLCNTSEKATVSIKYTSDSLVRDMIYQQAFQAYNISNLVHMISETYTEVSNLYIMDRVSSLGRLIALDPSSPNFNIERKKLADGCTTAQEGILNMVMEKKKEYEDKIDERVQKLKTELQALPAIPAECRKQIENNVSAGMQPSTTEETSAGMQPSTTEETFQFC